MDDLEKFIETSSPEEKKKFLWSPKHGGYFWRRLHACKRVCKDFEKQILSE